MNFVTVFLQDARRDDLVKVDWSLFFLHFEQAFSQLDRCLFEKLRCFYSFWKVLLYESLQLDGSQVLDIDVAHLVFFALVDVPEGAKQSEVFWLSTNHLSGQIEVLEDSVVADHYWHDRHLLSNSRKGLKGVQEPANRHVGMGLA